MFAERDSKYFCTWFKYSWIRSSRTFFLKRHDCFSAPLSMHKSLILLPPTRPPAIRRCRRSENANVNIYSADEEIFPPFADDADDFLFRSIVWTMWRNVLQIKSKLFGIPSWQLFVEFREEENSVDLWLPRCNGSGTKKKRNENLQAIFYFGNLNQQTPLLFLVGFIRRITISIFLLHE